MVDGVCLPTATTCVDRGMNLNYSSIGNITCYTRDTCNIEPSECFDYGNGFEYCDNLADMGYPGVLCGGGLCDDWGAVDCFIWDPCWEPPEVMEGHTYNNSCEEDTIDNCGKHGYRCPSVDHGTVKCDSGICYVDSCETGYYISDSWPETCVRDETWCDGDLEYCHGVCIDVFWDNNNCGGCDVKCDGVCEDGSCIDGGHGSGDVTNCGLNHTNCTRISGWLEGECREGECVVTKCRFSDQSPVYDMCISNIYTCIDWGYTVPRDENGDYLDYECFSLDECEDPDYATLCSDLGRGLAYCNDPNYDDLACLVEEACQRENIDPADCFMWLYPYSM